MTSFSLYVVWALQGGPLSCFPRYINYTLMKSLAWWKKVSQASRRAGTSSALRLLVVLLLGLSPLDQVLDGTQHRVDGLLQLLGKLRRKHLREVCKTQSKKEGTLYFISKCLWLQARYTICISLKEMVWRGNYQLQKKARSKSVNVFTWPPGDWGPISFEHSQRLDGVCLRQSRHQFSS